MKNYNKLFKWLMWALIIVSVVLLVWGMVKGYPALPVDDNGTVDPLLFWAYFMVGLGIFCVVVFGIIVAVANNPKSLVKLGIGLLAAAAVCFVAYLLAKANPAVGMLEQPSHSVLKLTDTILNLTYFAGAAAIVTIVFGEIMSAVRNK